MATAATKILIFGGSGRSGQAMAHAARERGYEVAAPTHAACELGDTQAVANCVQASGARIVVNCAAVSRLEACADDAATARRINADAPAAMACACAGAGARFIHLSTDYVLDGLAPGLKGEGAPCLPCCVYGASKLAGERAVAKADASALILRVSWLCGNPRRPGFPESIAAKALAGLPLAAIADKDSLPTDVGELATAALTLAERGESGLFHLCSTAAAGVSWWQLACWAVDELVAAGALASAPPIERQELAKATFFREPRPRHTAMDNAKLRALGIALSSAEETVRRAVRRYLAARA